MSAVLREALRKGHILTAIMVEMDHPSGFAYLWSGVGDLDFGGNVYTGAGKLGEVRSVADTLEPEIIETRFVLSGVDADLLGELNTSVKGRIGEVWEAILSPAMVVLERELLARTRLDYQVFNVGEDGKASITVVAHGGLFFLRNRSAAKLSPEQMKVRFPDETGFDHIYTVADQTDRWAPA